MAKKAGKKVARKVARTKRASKDESSSLLDSFSRLAFDAQAVVLTKLNDMYEGAKNSRAAELMAELTRLGVTPGKKRGRPAKKADNGFVGNGRPAHALKGKSLKAAYRSKNDPSLTWAGRGQMPRWMREEMKGTKLTKEDFAI